jgi:hypothetical protein
MPTIWDAPTRQTLVSRVRQLSPDAKGLWGKMNARQMLAHVNDAGKMALGELTAKPKKLPIRYFPIRELFIYWLPFAKNLPTAPELQGRSADDWDAELREFEAVFNRLVAQQQKGAFPEHPAFGKMSARAWGVLVARHVDHHLKQFGV